MLKIRRTFASQFWGRETQRNSIYFRECIGEKSEQHGNRTATVPYFSVRFGQAVNSKLFR